MSAILLDQVIAYTRASFSKAEVAEVAEYAGEFSGEEVDQLSFSAPAILITVLGWREANTGHRLGGRFADQVRLAAFVVTKHAQRGARMRQAMQISRKLCLALRLWAPDSAGLAETIGPLEGDPRAENLYGRAIDKRGLALWLVDWQQAIKPAVSLPTLYDLTTIDITDHTVQGRNDAAVAPGVAPTVTEDVQFNALPPA
jgi:phage gp37-like protein